MKHVKRKLCDTCTVKSCDLWPRYMDCENYKGRRVMLIHMDDKRPVPPGTEGTVTRIDDAGNIRVIWDNKSTLALVPGVDTFKYIT